MTAEQTPPNPTHPLLRFFDNATSGFFVEAGVRDPLRSMTAPLETAGWTGVLVEPRPEIAAFLVTLRSARIVAAACVATGTTEETLPLRVVDPVASLETRRRTASMPARYTIMVPTRTLDDILAEAEAVEPLDLLVIDSDGRELDALLGLDLTRWQPRLIVVADPATDLRLHRFLNKNGYGAIQRVDGRGWYVPAGSPALETCDRWSIVRSYYLAMPFRKVWRALRRLGARIMASAD